MEELKKLGIWMDHAHAKLIDVTSENKNSTVKSKFTFETKDEAIRKNENLMHNKEQHMQEAYYKGISEKILNYNHVLLFGPTNAKAELHNYLNKDLHFKDIKIDIEDTDKMTDNNIEAFVTNHFKSKV